MAQYFFDISTGVSVQYDYRGREFHNPDQAHEFAQLLALDLGCSAGDNAINGEVQVRDPKGGHLFSIQIQPSESIAA